ncbi:sensor histidine kinase [Emticicia sp. SJ17W-69]|uniref:sensor histidine kinase n=1 Tax=Emticicia sp. SJ17W-69 TaxID=3421657 RepID=UPI003EBA909A
MRRTILILLLILPTNIWAQSPKLDSLKNVLSRQSARSFSIERDSLLTTTMYEICSSISLAEPGLRQTWTDSLSKFAKVSTWQQSIAYSHLAISRNYHFKGFTTLAFKEIEAAAWLFKQFCNEKMYATAFSGLAVIITNFLLVKPLADDATERKYLNYLTDGLALAKKQANPIQIANMNLCLMQYYIKHKNFEEAKKCAINSWKITQTNPEKYFYYYQAGKWAEGLNLLYLGKQKEGIYLINQTKEICQHPRKDGMEKYLLAANGLYLGNYYIEKKAYQNALVEAKIGQQALKSLKLPNFDYILNKIFYQAYKNLGKPMEALMYFEKVQAYDQEEQTKETMSKFLDLQLKYEDEKQKNRIQNLENQQLTQTRNFLLLAGLLGLGIIGYIFWNNQKLKKKNEEIQKALLQGQTMERKRMASELHDNISNKILGVKMRVELLENEHFTEKDRVNYNATLGFIEEVYTDIRLVSHNLLPEELEINGLGTAIENLVKKLNLIGKTHFDFKIQTHQKRFPARLEYEIYSIILELVNNTLKHAHAENAMISIIEDEKVLKISVKDNGKGFDNQAFSFDNLGLKNIRSRIESLRGNIKIESDEGTNVLMSIPI